MFENSCKFHVRFASISYDSTLVTSSLKHSIETFIILHFIYTIQMKQNAIILLIHNLSTIINIEMKDAKYILSMQFLFEFIKTHSIFLLQILDSGIRCRLLQCMSTNYLAPSGADVYKSFLLKLR